MAGFVSRLATMAEVRRPKLVFLFLLLTLSAAAPAWAAPIRRMLVVFKSSEGVTAKEGEARWHLSPILEKQGWKLDYQDVDAGLPDDAKMAAYQAVLSWHRTAVYKNPEAYVRWMRDQAIAGRKVLIFGNFGAYTADNKTWVSNDVLNEFFVPFGLDYEAGYTGDASQLKLVSEQKPAHAPKPPDYYLQFKSVNPDNRALVTVARKDMPNSDSALVVVTPRGAMATAGYVFQQKGKQLEWLLDRAAFLKTALAPFKPATAAGSSGPAGEPARTASGGHLLALYKGREGFDPQTNYVTRFLATPLKELGYTFDTWNIDDGVPPAASMAKYNGVISWYTTASMENAAAYCNWLTAQIMAGRKVVVVGNLGAFQELDSKSNPPTERWLLPNEYNSFLYPFGLEFKGMWTKDTSVLKVTERDDQMVPFLEPQDLSHFYWIQQANPEDKVYLRVKRTDAKDTESALVARTPYGGFVLENYLFRDVTGHGDIKFHVDMKKFLADSLTYKPKALPTAWMPTVKPSTPKTISGADTLPAVPALPADVKEVSRRVLCFYEKTQRESSEHNRIHDNLETVLFHLGLVCDYRAMEDGLPSDAEMAKYRGVVTWLGGDTNPDPKAYAEWFQRQIAAGRRIVMLGDYGAYANKSLTQQVNPGPALKALGVEWKAASPVNSITVNRVDLMGSNKSSIDYIDPVMCKGERAIDLSDGDLKKGWPAYLSADPANKVYLKVKGSDGQPCDAIMTTPHGGVIAGDFLEYLLVNEGKVAESIDTSGLKDNVVADEVQNGQFRIDPFLFFQEALATQDLPRCDVTTLNGSRIYFSNVDGDAMQGTSFIDRASLNAEMIYRELFSVVKLPVTVSYVTNNLKFKATPTYKRELMAARKIFTLPWVECASHSETHPFEWRVGDLKRIPDANGGEHLQRIPPDGPTELTQSVDYIEQVVCPSDKHCRVLLWSGMCNPDEDDLRLTDGASVVNMNGGDPVYDSIKPYLAGVFPVYSKVGERYQYHTCAAGDFYYTNAWTKNYDGMKRLVDYYQHTESPRRLRALNIYYHFYLAERDLGIQGLKIAMDYCLKQNPAPMFVSNYVGIVKDSIVDRVGIDAQGNYVVANSGALRTVRFDGKKQVPDLKKSTGVLGFSQLGDALYVHLDESKLHRIALTAAPGAAQDRTYIEKASHYVDGWKGSAQECTFTLKGVGPGHFTLAGLAANASYKVLVNGLGESTLRSDASGKLTWTGQLPTYDGVYAVRVSR